MAIKNKHTWADIIGALVSVLAIIVTFYEIIRHVRFNHHKEIGKYVIRILLMVPIYVIESYLGVLIPEAAVYLNTMRDIYEAIAVYSFYQLLINTLGGYSAVNKALQTNHPNPLPHISPFSCCCKPWKFNIQDNIDISNDINTLIQNYNELSNLDIEYTPQNKNINEKNENNNENNESKDRPLLQSIKQQSTRNNLYTKLVGKVPKAFRYHNPRS